MVLFHLNYGICGGWETTHTNKCTMIKYQQSTAINIWLKIYAGLAKPIRFCRFWPIWNPWKKSQTFAERHVKCMISSSKLLEQFTSGTSHAYWLSCLKKQINHGASPGAIPVWLDSLQKKNIAFFEKLQNPRKKSTNGSVVLLLLSNMLKQCETWISNMSILGCQRHILLCCYGIILFGSFHRDINLSRKIKHQHFSPSKAKAHSIYFVTLSLHDKCALLWWFGPLWSAFLTLFLVY